MNPMDGHNRRTSGREKGSNIPQKESAYGILTEVTVFVSGQFKFHSCSVGLCIVFHKGGEKESNFFFLQFSASQIILVFIVWLFHKSESCFSLQQQGDFNYLVYMKIFFVLCIKYVLLEVN